MNVTEIYCDVDDFCKVFLPAGQVSRLPEKPNKRQRVLRMSPAEVMTLLIWFQSSNYRDFKHYYTNPGASVLKREFPNRVSYNRLIELAQSVLIPLCAYLHTRRVSSRGIALVDSTPVKVCHNRRIGRHRTLAGLAQRGKDSVDWFYGFKLHLSVDDRGERVSFFVTPGNVDERQGLRKMAKFIKGKLFGDKGYISKVLAEELWDKGVQLVTRVRRHMKPVVRDDFDNLLLRKRTLIETINDQLKNIAQLEHSRHRSITGFMLNLVAAWVAYSFQPNKPSLKLSLNNQAMVVVDGDNGFYTSQ
ncbi:MAG: IS982 family transposase [Thioploca sp.]|nr:IS982 family transposase [Thioploca sp.]